MLFRLRTVGLWPRNQFKPSKARVVFIGATFWQTFADYCYLWWNCLVENDKTNVKKRRCKLAKAGYGDREILQKSCRRKNMGISVAVARGVDARFFVCLHLCQDQKRTDRSKFYETAYYIYGWSQKYTYFKFILSYFWNK